MTIYYSYGDKEILIESEVRDGFNEYKEYIKFLIEFSNEQIQKMLKENKTLDEIDDTSEADLWENLKDEYKKELYEKAFTEYVKENFLTREI